MMQLSKGGADAVVMREFDLDAKCFVQPRDKPFVIPEGKTRVAWKSIDVLLVGTSMLRVVFVSV
jgi:prolyl oligopeptidase